MKDEGALLVFFGICSVGADVRKTTQGYNALSSFIPHPSSLFSGVVNRLGFQ
jgi:hypothetical protein